MVRYKMVESGLTHVLHSIVITAVAYLFMLYVLKQNPSTAETRSLAIGSATLAYMLVFGHGAPSMGSLKL